MSVTPFAIDRDNPWPGLESFDETAERYFNGRRPETAELRRLVQQATLTVLFGKSGLGKTSLIRAGLFPLLRKEHVLPVYVRLDVRHRGAALIDQVTEALKTELRRLEVDGPRVDGAESLWHYLHREDLELWSAQNQLLTPLFVFDQFEEVFTLGAENPEGIAALRADLADLIENRIPAPLAARMEESEAAAHGLALHAQRYRVIVSFREDFLAAMEGWKRELPSLMRNRLRLLPMSGEQAFEAVHDTAPHLVDAPLATRIVRFVAAARDDQATEPRETGGDLGDLTIEPALLSLVCRGLNEKRKTQGKAAFDTALLEGTGRAIVSDYYLHALVDLPERAHQFIENELITGSGFRKPCAVDDARAVHGMTDRELRLLVDRRLLRMEPRQGTEWVELTHDLLSGVVRERRDERRERERAQAMNRARRRRRGAVLIASATALLLVIAVVVSTLWARASAERRRADTERRRAETERTRAQVLQGELDRQRLEQIAKQAAAQAELATMERDRATRSATAAQDQERLAQQLRQQAEAGRLAAGLQQLAATGGAGSAPRSALLAIESIARSREANLFRPTVAGQLLRDVLGTTGGRPVAALTGPIGSVASSPDGRWLALAHERTVRLVDAARPEAAPLVIGDVPSVTAVGVASDGRQVAAGGQGGEVRLWRTTGATTSAPLVLRHAIAPVRALAFGADGRRLASGTADGGVRLWDIGEGGEAPPVVLGRMPGEVRLLAFSPDGTWLAAMGTGDSRVRLWNVEKPAPATPVMLTPEDSPDRTLLALAFSPDGRRLAITYSYSAQMWVARGGTFAPKPIALGTAAQWLLSLAFSADGRQLAAGGIDSNVQLYTFSESGDAVAKTNVLRGHSSTITAVRFGPKRPWLATASSDSTIRLWHVDDLGVAPVTLRGHEAGITALVFSGDGGKLVSVGEDERVRTWDVPDAFLDPIVLRGHAQGIVGAAISPDAKWLATAAGDDTVKLWNLSAPTGPPKVLNGHRPGLAESPVTFSPDGRWLAAVGKEASQVQLWDMTGDNASTNAVTLREHESFITDIRFSRNRRWLAAGDWNGRIVVWKLGPEGSPPSPAHRLSHRAPIRALAFSADGGRLISGDHHGTAMVWDLSATDPSSKPLVLRHRSTVRTVAISPDGRWAGTGTWENDFAARLWDLAAADPTASPGAMKFRGRVFDMAFSRDGRWLAAGAWDGGVQLMDVASPAKKVVSLLGHQGRVLAVAFSHDGEWLASSSEDHTVRLWKLGENVPSSIVLRHAAAVGSIAFSPDNRWLASASGDATAQLWRMRLEDLISVACQTAGRNLTPVEWRDFLPGRDYRRTCPDLATR